MDNITIIIKTFERPRSLFRLLKSIASHYPTCPVIIADDSSEPQKDKVLSTITQLNIDYHTMPFDSGVSAGRNLALRNVRTPYFVHCDDDFVFDRRADLRTALDLLEKHELDLVGGLYYDVFPITFAETVRALFTLNFFRIRSQLFRQGVPRRFFGNFITQDDGSVKLEEIVYTPPLVRCDLVQNFFIAKTQRVRDTVGGWNEKIKIGGDHEEFFYRAKTTGLKVAQTESFGTVHYREVNPNYAAYRARAKEMRPREFKDWY